MTLAIDKLANAPRFGLSRTEVALFVGVSPNFVDQLIKDELLPRARKVGTRKIWLADEVKAYMLDWPVDGEAEQDAERWRAS